MSVLETALFASAAIALLIWLILLIGWGQFWRADQRLDGSDRASLPSWPSVTVVIPARNEADLIATAIRSHLNQTYLGPLSVLLVDDHSTDGTADIALQIAQSCGKADQLSILRAAPLPSGWTGKLWAMEQGFRYLQQASHQTSQPDYVLFTDADIEHDKESLQQLVLKAKSEKLDLVSLMVKLRCQSLWEILLIPAFIFFFQMLYPFPWVNNPRKKTAAAAGGCALIRFSALAHIDGLQSIRDALIDDCALGAAIKQQGAIWLGLSTTTRSLRPYATLKSIWDMVARSAYTQLNYSLLLLAGTIVGMLLLYVALPLSVLCGILWAQPALFMSGLLGWLLMAIAYWPTLRLYDVSPLLAPALPGIAFLYLLMTLDSARQHWQGQGGAWKGRVYPASN